MPQQQFGSQNATQTELERPRDAEMYVVKRQASLDEATLMDTIKSLILHTQSSSKSGQLQVATIVQKRLEVSHALSNFGLVLIVIFGSLANKRSNSPATRSVGCVCRCQSVQSV